MENVSRGVASFRRLIGAAFWGYFGFPFVFFRLTGAVMGIFTAFCLIYFVIMKDPRNLVSLSGIIFLLIISVLISRHPSKVRHKKP